MDQYIIFWPRQLVARSLLFSSTLSQAHSHSFRDQYQLVASARIHSLNQTILRALPELPNSANLQL